MAASNRLVFIDRDGVINRDSPDYIKSPDEWQPLPGSLDAIAALTAAGFRIVTISNQSGVGRGLLTEAALEKIHAKMTLQVEAAGGRIAAIYFCPHLPNDGCECRKPRPGMLERAAADLNIEPTGAPLIGDKLADMELARTVGARPILVLTGYGQETLAAKGGDDFEIYPDLAAAARVLIEELPR